MEDVDGRLERHGGDLSGESEEEEDEDDAHELKNQKVVDKEKFGEFTK